ncbi:MAG: aminotransferase class V-fold PLP-dependent enzyme [Myxococcota bacterium]|jgi:glutamate/tyrosine decarboxylase-like PLP-dependent enzyme|nr:aminotransferase class V-fold PLP-dependent enzyme [Myxococcota bacterium]
MADVKPRFGFDEEGLGAEAVVRELDAIARSEDGVWADGRCSGTIYCGDRAIYDLIAKAYGHFSYVNVLQRDMCPSQTRFESEIIAMTLDMLHGDAARERGLEPCGVIGSGGSESIISSIYTHREWGRATKGITAPEMILPDTAHVAFDKGAHYFGVKVITAPVDPVTTLVDVDFVREHINRNTVLLVGSAGNYPYGTIDPIAALSDLAVEHDVGLHVDGCLGGFILPWGERLGYDIPPFDFRHPGVTTISADTHKYGYGPKGTSVLLFRDKALRRHLYFARPDWKGGMYASPGMGGSRSGGLIAATWAVMVALGRQGYLDKARRVFETAFAMQTEVKKQSALRLMGSPTFCFSFTSDAFDIYHVNDFMKQRGWRFNGQQFPSAIHMCVTGPQTQPGVPERFGADLVEAVAYARNPDQPIPRSGALYGGQGTRAMAKDLDLDRLREGLMRYIDSTLEQPRPG